MTLGCPTAGAPRTGTRAPAGRAPQADCHQKIDDLFSGKLYLIGIAAIVVAVIMVSRCGRGAPQAHGPRVLTACLLVPSLQIFEMILSMVLCCGIRNSSVY